MGAPDGGALHSADVRMLATFADFPPRQEPASFTVEKVMEKLQAGVSSA